MAKRTVLRHVRLSRVEDDRLRRHAETSGLSPSSILRGALEHYLGGAAPHAEEILKAVGAIEQRLHEMALYLEGLHAHLVTEGWDQMITDPVARLAKAMTLIHAEQRDLVIALANGRVLHAEAQP